MYFYNSTQVINHLFMDHSFMRMLKIDFSITHVNKQSVFYYKIVTVKNKKKTYMHHKFLNVFFCNVLHLLKLVLFVTTIFSII